MSSDEGRAPIRAGTEGKSDCRVGYLPTKAPLSVIVDSSVAKLFGRAVEAAARRCAAALGVETGELAVKDDGALDLTVEARVEAVLRAAFPERRQPSAGAAPGVGAAPGAGAAPGPAVSRGAAAAGPSPRGMRRRSRLYVPGNQPDFFPNAGLFGADCLVLDLEDSVAPERKAEARILVRKVLETRRDFFGAAEIVVRINSLSGPFGLADLAEIVPAFPQALILPKCESGADVEALDRELSRLEEAARLPAGSILVMPLVETARGISNAAAIAASSSRNAALCFGAEDFARDLGVARTAGGAESLYARQAVVVAARAAGIQAQDSVFSDVDDEAGLAASCAEARALGFDGKGLLHPRQIAVAHAAYAASQAELAEAARVVAALEAAGAAGSGVASLDGKMIDAPVAARARRLLADAAGEGRP